MLLFQEKKNKQKPYAPFARKNWLETKKSVKAVTLQHATCADMLT